MILAIGIGLLIIGLVLDLLSLWWGIQTARTGIHKSGILLVPLIFYAGFIFLCRSLISLNIWTMSFIAILFHFSCYILLPTLLEKALNKE